MVRILYVLCITHNSVLHFLIVVCRYLHERFVQLQEEVSLLKTNLMKYKVCGEESNETSRLEEFNASHFSCLCLFAECAGE